MDNKTRLERAMIAIKRVESKTNCQCSYCSLAKNGMEAYLQHYLNVGVADSAKITMEDIEHAYKLLLLK